MILRSIRSKKGSALISVVIVMMMVSMFGVSYIGLTTTNLLRAKRDERRATAFHLAEAALEYKIADITTKAHTNGGRIVAESFDSTYLLNTLRSDASGAVTVVPDTGLDSYATITSTATYRGIMETIKVRVRIKGIGVWDNAIFAGTGQAGRGINGNVDIRGSVHILGDGDPYSDLNGNGAWDCAESFTDLNGNGKYDASEPFVDSDGNGVRSAAEPYQDNNMNGQYDPPLTATDLAESMSGNANIGNNYNGIPVELQSKIPSLVGESIDGETVNTLHSELRVKHGKVNISGTASVGSTNITGNSVRETIEGTYVSDGWGGSQGANHVYSDNGSGQGYDLGDKVRFPSLFDSYKDKTTGIQYDHYEDYLRANSLLIAVNKIDSTVPAFNLSDGTNSISWNPATGSLNVTGIVRNIGNMDLAKNNESIYYNGRGTMFIQGDVRVHGNIMPTTMFPSTDALGIIARQDIYLATGTGESQIKLMGAWYAQRKIVSAKQSQFAGTYVSSYFDMGTNVPSIYQVPELSRNLPPGMPGGDTRLVVSSVLSWKHM